MNLPKVNIVEYLSKINNIGKYVILTVLLMNLVSIVSAGDTGETPEELTNALRTLCTISQQFLAVAVMVLIVLAGAVYAIGQVLGAETRARASVWATAMLTGALIGVIIYLVAPVILSQLIPESAGGVTDPGDPCSF